MKNSKTSPWTIAAPHQPSHVPRNFLRQTAEGYSSLLNRSNFTHPETKSPQKAKRLSKATVFRQAVKEAERAYIANWLDEIQGDGNLKVIIDCQGDVSTSYTAGRSRSEAEYFGMVPHDLTLWEINGRDVGSLDEILGEDAYHYLASLFAAKYELESEEPYEWAEVDRHIFLRALIKAIAMPILPDLEQKRQEFNNWATDNLRLPKNT